MQTPVASLSQHLRRVSPVVSRFSQIAFDERFRRWFSQALRRPTLDLAFRDVAAPLVLLDLQANEGRARVAVSRSALPPALGAVLAMDDQAVACEAATELLGDTFARFTPVLSELRVTRCTRRDLPARGLALPLAGGACSLCAADARLTDHLARVCRDVPPALEAWAGLRLRARLRIAVRHWPLRFISSLASGDLVLLHRKDPQLLIIGTGMTMQADAFFSAEDDTVQTDGELHMAAEGPDDAAAPEPGHIDELQLPVSFEIDTARMSLAELAGMRPGYVVELDAPLLHARVRLVCQGQTIGAGQLVAVGEQLAVLISRMGPDHAASDA